MFPDILWWAQGPRPASVRAAFRRDGSKFDFLFYWGFLIRSAGFVLIQVRPWQRSLKLINRPHRGMNDKISNRIPYPVYPILIHETTDDLISRLPFRNFCQKSGQRSLQSRAGSYSVFRKMETIVKCARSCQPLQIPPGRNCFQPH